MLAAAGSLAWNAVSKHRVLLEAPGSAARHCVDHVERRRLVQRRELGQRVQLVEERVVDACRRLRGRRRARPGG